MHLKRELCFRTQPLLADDRDAAEEEAASPAALVGAMAAAAGVTPPRGLAKLSSNEAPASAGSSDGVTGPFAAAGPGGGGGGGEQQGQTEVLGTSGWQSRAPPPGWTPVKSQAAASQDAADAGSSSTGSGAPAVSGGASETSIQ